MDRKEFAERRQEILRQIDKLAVPADPNQKKRDKLLNELDKLDRAENKLFEDAVMETHKLLKDDIRRLEKMCEGTFSGTVAVKAKVRVRLNIPPCSLETYTSTCGVDMEFPKDRRKLALFAIDDDEELSCANILNTKQARGLLPELDRHLDKLEALQGKIIKRIKQEAKRHGIEEDVDYFIDEVMNPS